jgi:hypothetical protein
MGEKLFAKLDIGFSDHAKIIGLSDSAFRAFIEALLYSRQQLTDGFLDERVVLRKWGQSVIDELTSNDPSNPSWVRVDGGFRIHDFEKNQMTNADIEAKRAAGRAGGLAKAQRNASKSLAGATKVLEQNASKTLLEKIREDKNKELNVTDEIRNDVLTLCEFLSDKIEDNGSKRPTPNKQWYDAARLLLDRDGRDYIEAKQLIIWCQENTFWRANILSMPKFREKYDQLRLQREKELTPDPYAVVTPEKHRFTDYVD